MVPEVIAQFYEMYHTNNPSMLDSLVTPGYAAQINGRTIDTIEAAKGFVQAFLSAFPDIRYTLHDTIVAGDRVVTRWNASGTHRGAFAGVAATDLPVVIEGITIFQIEQGSIAALWSTWDALGLLNQIQHTN